eukprot:TRINITY_DN1520_c0_g1_i6.p1 TRINITY_DN1520_c0_g1~~TRINITY_DN1520_c0_g1_i6.p1  ORF type:complete len:448 (-),score=107.18 TRINITY_DN1520_c0_g1_i6:21-1364(-)
MVMENIHFERYFMRDVERTRSLFKKGAVSLQNEASRLWAEWLEFEREVGTLDQWEAARSTISARSEELLAKQAKEVQTLMDTAAERSAARKAKRAAGRDGNATTEQRGGERRGKRDREEGNIEGGKRARGSALPPPLRAPVYTVAISNLPFTTEEVQLRQFLEENIPKHNDGGDVVSGIRLMKGKDGRPRGMAFVDLATEDAMNAAISSLHKSTKLGRAINVEKSVGVAPSAVPIPTGSKQHHTDEHTIFIKNLGYRVTDQEIKTEFEKYGTVVAVRSLRDKESGRFRGLAYVEFEDDDTVQRSLRSHGALLQGRAIHVEVSHPTRPHAPSAKKTQQDGGDDGDDDHTTNASNNNTTTTTTTTTTTAIGGGEKSKDTGSTISEHPKQRLMMPRALALKGKQNAATNAGKPSSSSSSTAGTDAQQTSEQSAAPVPKSNADFKKFLLNK